MLWITPVCSAPASILVFALWAACLDDHRCPCTAGVVAVMRHVIQSCSVVVQAWAKKELGEALAGDTTRLPSVYVLSDHIPQSHFPRLFKSANGFVLPTR